MKKIIVSFVSVLLSVVAAQAGKPDLLPVPVKINYEEPGAFRLDATFKASVQGVAHPRLYGATTRMLQRLAGRTGLFFTQDIITAATPVTGAQFLVYCKKEGRVQLGEDESYELVVAPDKIELSCVTDLGGLRGLETLLQLLQADAEGYYFPAVTIRDQPRFPWRGLMIDVCRHWMPMEVIKRNLDGMAAVKMNILHLHLTEDQGFRIESKIYPKLHQMGSDGNYFTQEQIREIIAYADARGIRVIPEFDMPGHATAWFVGHPELASAPGPYTIERRWGIMDPAMDPSKESTYAFLDKFLGEMARLFPDPYLHIGGDENNGKHWNANPAIQAFMKKNNIADNHALQAYFNKRILNILTKHGKKMVGWDEILHPDMPRSIVIQSWRGPKFLVESARNGYQGILSNGYYIDLIQPASFHYLNDPIPADSALTDAEQARIMGGEATSWAELVTPETVDSRIWPRTAAIAERLWSAADVRDVDDMYRRLATISLQLEEHGLTHIRNYEMMLRRLTNHQDITTLKTLVDVIEPVKIYQRHHQGVSYFSYSPYTRAVDAARPESMTARAFARGVDEFLHDPAQAGAEKILHYLTQWRDNHAPLLEIMQKSPVIRELETLSQDLADLSAAGLKALHALLTEQKLDAAWQYEQRLLADRAKKPRGQTELMVVPAIQKLIDAACAE